jgi:hypothetical protein
MNAVSSYKPFHLSIPCALNQWRAFDSWKRVFDGVVYFGEPCRTIDEGAKFVPAEQFPRIKDMAAYCAKLPGWSCLINADIVIGENFRDVEFRLMERGASCATSRRYEFDGESIEDGKIEDMGMDFFAATQPQWMRFAYECPDILRIGGQLWDTWALGFFNTIAPKTFFDITPCKVIFHPRHGDRNYTPVEPFQNKYFDQLGSPLQKLYL